MAFVRLAPNFAAVPGAGAVVAGYAAPGGRAWAFGWSAAADAEAAAGVLAASSARAGGLHLSLTIGLHAQRFAGLLEMW